jgi:hypothetical protein
VTRAKDIAKLSLIYKEVSTPNKNYPVHNVDNAEAEEFYVLRNLVLP